MDRPSLGSTFWKVIKIYDLDVMLNGVFVFWLVVLD